MKISSWYHVERKIFNIVDRSLHLMSRWKYILKTLTLHNLFSLSKFLVAGNKDFFLIQKLKWVIIDIGAIIKHRWIND